MNTETIQIMPIVHLNGTHPNDLMKQQRAVMDACRALQDALSEAMPNGRDYYVHPTADAFQHVREAHSDRLKAVEWIYEEALACAMHIADTAGERLTA